MPVACKRDLPDIGFNAAHHQTALSVAPLTLVRTLEGSAKRTQNVEERQPLDYAPAQTTYNVVQLSLGLKGNGVSMKGSTLRR
jgi:hypothetical protein